MEKMLLPEDICDALGIKISTLHSWTSKGLIPHLKVNGLLRFREGEIELWLKLKERGYNISEVKRILRKANELREDG
jgi:DNA-binding transcriptional MerR regulator